MKFAILSNTYHRNTQDHEMRLDFIKANLIPSKCVRSLLKCSWPAGWLQGLALPCACVWALVAFSADLCRSLLRLPYLQFACPADFCGSLFWSPILPIQCPSLPTPHRNPAKAGIRLGTYISPLKFLQCDGVGWWPPAGLVPTHMVATEPPCCVLYIHRAPNNLWWHPFSSSSISNEFKT